MMIYLDIYLDLRHFLIELACFIWRFVTCRLMQVLDSQDSFFRGYFDGFSQVRRFDKPVSQHSTPEMMNTDASISGLCWAAWSAK